MYVYLREVTVRMDAVLGEAVSVRSLNINEAQEEGAADKLSHGAAYVLAGAYTVSKLVSPINLVGTRLFLLSSFYFYIFF